MKKLPLLTILLAVVLCSCNKYDIETTETVVNLRAGDTYQLKVDCSKPLEYESTKEVVAAVSNDGLVEAIRVGTAEIKISTLKDEVTVKINVLRVDGYFHPVKKISKIYEVDDFSGENVLSLNWIWENGSLIKINEQGYYYDEQGRISSVGAATYLSYGDEGLERIESYVGTWPIYQAFYHYEDGILSEIVENENSVDVFPENGRWYTHKLTWENGNVVRIDTQYKYGDFEQSYSTVYTYDDKANPFCGFPNQIAFYGTFYFLMLNENNCLTEKLFDGQGNDEHEIRYAYTYDGDYPIYVCDTYGNQYYYEYE